MSLVNLIRGKSESVNVATAIPAISATQPTEDAAAVARIATVAVAIPSGQETEAPNDPAAPLTERETASLRAWLDQIGEDDPAIIAHVLHQCRCDVEARRYFLRRASSTTELVDREAFEERAAIREYDGGYSREDAEMLAAWELTQALFQRLTAREWLARYAPERLPAGDKPENYPIAEVKPGNDFWLERERRGGRR